MTEVVGALVGRKQIWEMKVPRSRGCLKPLSRSNKASKVFWPRLVFQLPSSGMGGFADMFGLLR
jgi:hypothetical protein